MARNQSPTEVLLKQVVASGVTAVLKPAGFRKTGMNFHRRHGDTVQVVNVQVSHGSSWDEKRFYINAGIAFDAICHLVNVPVLEKLKESECDKRGTRDRLGGLVRADDDWTLRTGEDVERIKEQVRTSIEDLRVELDKIDGPLPYRFHRWFDRFRPTDTNAQILYLIDDLDGSWEELISIVKYFADRAYPPDPAKLIEKLGLIKLKSRAS